ncbi:MAG: hypothetical protein EAZ66_07580, partial [Alphaproteobacteria bacterium]
MNGRRFRNGNNGRMRNNGFGNNGYLENNGNSNNGSFRNNTDIRNYANRDGNQNERSHQQNVQRGFGFNRFAGQNVQRCYNCEGKGHFARRCSSRKFLKQNQRGLNAIETEQDKDWIDEEDIFYNCEDEIIKNASTYCVLSSLKNGMKNDPR